MGKNLKMFINSRNIDFLFLAEVTGATEQELKQICDNNKPIDALLNYKICKYYNLPFEYFI